MSTKSATRTEADVCVVKGASRERVVVIGRIACTVAGLLRVGREG